MPHDNCDQCQEDYDFDGERDIAVLYLRDADCNHIEAHCPFCQSTARIYVEPEIFISLLGQVSFRTVRMYSDAPDDIKAGRRSLEAPQKDEPKALPPSGWVRTEDLPQIPRNWLTNLWDTFREFGGES